jgi:hypothetical protein
MSSFKVHKLIFWILAISDSGRLWVHVRKNIVGGINGPSINKDFDEKKEKEKKDVVYPKKETAPCCKNFLA